MFRIYETRIPGFLRLPQVNGVLIIRVEKKKNPENEFFFLTFLQLMQIFCKTSMHQSKINDQNHNKQPMPNANVK